MRQSIARAILLSLFLCSPFFYAHSFSDDLNTAPASFFDETNTNWDLTKSKSNINIFTSAQPDSKFKAFKASTIINAPIADVFAVLADAPSCPLWVDKCIRSGTLKLNSFTDRLGFAINNLPWPLKNRYMIVHILTYQEAKGKEIHITMSAIKNPANEVAQLDLNANENILLTDSHTHYVLTPISKNETELVWMQHTNPDGAVPSWLVNLMITDLPIKSLKNLKEIVQLPRYQNAELIYNTDNKLQGLRLSNGQMINHPKS